MASIFNAINTRRRQDVNFDISTFIEELSPRTPSIVPMNDFNLNIIRDSVLLNIAQQPFKLTADNMHKLLEFLNDDFLGYTKKTAIQILIHYSKMNIKVLHGRYLTCAVNLPEEDKMTAEKFFNKAILLYVESASQEFGVEATVTQMDESSKLFIKTHLQGPPILNALSIVLRNIDNDRQICIDELQKAIQSMKIYSTNKFGPCDELRGACLLDGILICTGKLASVIGTDKYMADMITLAAHECSHYLARILLNNLNFSTPFKFGGVERFDPVEKDVHMELGRFIELILFDNVQPNWAKSTINAAQTFLRRLKDGSPLPLIKKVEHDEIGLEARLVPSLPFGVDMAEDDYVFD